MSDSVHRMSLPCNAITVEIAHGNATSISPWTNAIPSLCARHTIILRTNSYNYSTQYVVIKSATKIRVQYFTALFFVHPHRSKYLANFILWQRVSHDLDFIVHLIISFLSYQGREEGGVACHFDVCSGLLFSLAMSEK